MLEILAAYLLIKCYVSFDASKTSFWGYEARRSDRTTEQCLADFRRDVERLKASEAGKQAVSWWQRTKTQFTTSFDRTRLEQATTLSAADMDRLLTTVAQNVKRMNLSR